MFWEKRKVALALGGGSARGLAHLGVFKVLEEHGLKPDIIVGTSFGAIIGAAYASNEYSIDGLIQKMESVIFSDEFKNLGLGLFDNVQYESNIKFIQQLRTSLSKIKFYNALLNKKYMVENVRLKEVLKLILPDIKIEELPVKFAAVALDLNLKQEYLMDKGPLIKSVLASSCIPGVFQPVKMNKALLVDGGWINKVPVPFTRVLGANRIIAVDVSNPLVKKVTYKSGLGLLRFADNITSDVLKNYQILTADTVLSPIIKQIEWFEFSKYKKIIKYGEKCALDNIKQIKRLFKWRI